MHAMSKTAKILDKICGFIYWLVILFTVISLIGVGLLSATIFMDTQLLHSNQSYTLTLGSLQLLLAPGVLPEIVREGFEPWLLGTIVFSIAALPICFLMLLTVRDVLKPFINREPFHETVAKDLKRLSILVVANTVLNAIASGLMDHLTRNYLDLHRLFVGEQIFGDRIITAGLTSTTIDVSPLLFAGALFLLSKVFLYGQELQTLSDETL